VASIVERDGRWRALVRKAGHRKCATFGTKGAAQAWAKRVESEIDQLKGTGVVQPKGDTVADLIDRYTRDIYPLKPWGRSKAADLARLKADLGHLHVAELTGAHVSNYFLTRAKGGAGRVVINAHLGYLIGVLETARAVWHLDVPLQAVVDARTGLAKVGLVGKSKRRDRRVSDAEVTAIADAILDAKATKLPVRDVLHFALVSAMRISEVCRLRWSDLNESDRTIVVRDRKHPTDKIGNDQVVPLLKVGSLDAFAIVQRQPRSGPRIFPHNPRTLGTYVTRASNRLNLTPSVRLHDLRHEGISRLFEAGYQIQEVALVSGHRDWGSLKRYTHVRARDLHRSATR
jgi:integrase